MAALPGSAVPLAGKLLDGADQAANSKTRRALAVLGGAVMWVTVWSVLVAQTA